MMVLQNYDEMNSKFNNFGWDLNAFLETAETHAMENGWHGNKDFHIEDCDGEYFFDLIDGGLSEYSIERDGKTAVTGLMLSPKDAMSMVGVLCENEELVLEQEITEPTYSMRMTLK